MNPKEAGREWALVGEAAADNYPLLPYRYHMTLALEAQGVVCP
jgi:hypothetical protein